MAAHPVAANLLMLVCLLGGFFLYTKTTKEVFPEFTLDSISISMSYPGASPEEVEQSIVLAIEEAIADIEGIGEITANASEGSAQVSAEVLAPDQLIRLAQDVKTAVDRISTFPVDAENLQVKVNNRRRDVISMAIYGDLDPWSLRLAAERVRDELEQQPEVGPVELTGAKQYQIHIEVSQDNLRKYQLSLPEIAQRVRQSAIELGGGRIETPRGEILVRMNERRRAATEFSDIPIISTEDGALVTLGQIATIREGFDDSNDALFYNGLPAIEFEIYRVGEQTPISVANAVRQKLAELESELPKGVALAIYKDRSELFEQRATLLMKNGLFGLALVVLFLALFLDVRLACWVSMGIPISFLGAFLLFPATDFTINIVTMFAFIIALGIVVDDAIISGENIYHYRQQGLPPLKAAVEGASEIAVPITISVLTNMVAFVPLLFVPGHMGKVFSVIPVVVIAVFFVSLIESLFVLPAHLTFPLPNKKKSSLMGRWKEGFNHRFENMVRNGYASFIRERIIPHRYLTCALFLAVLLGFVGYVFSGRMGMTLFPRIESDYAYASATMKVGAPESQMQQVMARLVESANRVVEENGGKQLAEGVLSSIRGNEVSVRVYLTKPEVRPISTKVFTQKWRKQLGALPGTESLSLLSNRGGPGSGAALTIELSHENTATLEQASMLLAESLRQFPNTTDITDGRAEGKRQLDFQMTPFGHAIGMTTTDVARQVRAAFYGSEALKQQRGRDEVRVLVRLPEQERSSEYDLHQLIIRAPDGSDVRLSDVVSVEEGRAFTVIERRMGRRIVQVSADVDPPSQANTIINTLQKEVLPNLLQRYPGLRVSFEGKQAEIRESVNALFMGLIGVLFVIYVLLAVLFANYTQPFMILLAIPFGTIGAVIGHMIMGYSLSVMSLFGMMALAGVVVNDSLILVEFANKKRKYGLSTLNAVVEAGIQRFRPIVLTTLTTFVGLAPMILETSRQARFLIPMALSLGFGILFATLLTLILIPALYMIIEDIHRMFGKVTGNVAGEAEHENTGLQQAE
tara:strand:- start:100 stop:3201 length:3102 start_codon:yes stop_codon:yes gene_type:complete